MPSKYIKQLFTTVSVASGGIIHQQCRCLTETRRGKVDIFFILVCSKTLIYLSLKVMHFHSFIAANDYNLGTQITDVNAVTLS